MISTIDPFVLHQQNLMQKFPSWNMATVTLWICMISCKYRQVFSNLASLLLLTSSFLLADPSKKLTLPSRWTSSTKKNFSTAKLSSCLRESFLSLWTIRFSSLCKNFQSSVDLSNLLFHKMSTLKVIRHKLSYHKLFTHVLCSLTDH